jgi:hypothetical protein
VASAEKRKWCHMSDSILQEIKTGVSAMIDAQKQLESRVDGIERTAGLAKHKNWEEAKRLPNGEEFSFRKAVGIA